MVFGGVSVVFEGTGVVGDDTGVVACGAVGVTSGAVGVTPGVVGLGVGSVGEVGVGVRSGLGGVFVTCTVGVGCGVDVAIAVDLGVAVALWEWVGVRLANGGKPPGWVAVGVVVGLKGVATSVSTQARAPSSLGLSASKSSKISSPMTGTTRASGSLL